jgi:pyrroloquinoline quinone (PQQ) biosynthesis protein C
MQSLDQPRLRHCTMLDGGPDEALRLIVGDNHYELRETSGDRIRFLKVKSLLDGRHTLDEIAATTGEDRRDIEDLVEKFDQLGLFRNEASEPLVSVDKVAPRLKSTLRMWKRQIGFHRLFQSLISGSARKEVLLGLFIETFQILRLGPQHMACAIAAAESHRLRNHLSEYLAAEYEHSSLLLQTCVNLGCRREQIEQAHPIVGTSSLVHMLSEIGRADTLAYMASLSLIEAQPEDAIEAERSMTAVAEAYRIDIAAFAPALSHMKADVAANHASLLDIALADIVAIESERLHRIVNMLHDLKHAYDQLHDGIMQYYSDISNYIPRLRVDYFSL